MRAPGKNSVFGISSGAGDYDEADLDAPGLDEEYSAGNHQETLCKDCFVGEGNNPTLAKDALV